MGSSGLAFITWTVPEPSWASGLTLGPAGPESGQDLIKPTVLPVFHQ